MNNTGVSQKAIIFNQEEKILILRRSGTAPYGALTWDLPGGDLDYGENAIKGITREIKEETGLNVKELKAFDVESHVNNKREFWVTIAYICKTDSDNVNLSYEHNQYKWIDPKEIKELEAMDKIKRFIAKL
jgi:8-oxo-dGTP diphosphatase